MDIDMAYTTCVSKRAQLVLSLKTYRAPVRGDRSPRQEVELSSK